ncbi:Divalent cation transporter [Candidatus Terasakiella magnetica]|uniref:Magnesium transporter MgtE n=1 Tax=Candidatus Terasakiella magnetica TaxID=1867952 RepID=A0A1C3RDG6_9PROT|nr:magnesium transporter [Candidatus Terasakiella magnetica]SCA55254.1 Divalent cation transporter [Candidatus Terasakiella magnetica]
MSDLPEQQVVEEPEAQTQVDIEQGDAFGFGDEHVNQVRDHLRSDNKEAIKGLFEDLHYADVADVVQQLKPDDRSNVLKIVGQELEPEVWSELDEDILEEVVDEIGADTVARAIVEMEDDDALAVIEELDEDDQKEVLEALPHGERSVILEGLSFPEDSAGRMMQRDLVTVPAFWSVGETLDYLRSDIDLPENFYEIFVVDPKQQPLGTVPLNQLLRNKRPVRVAKLMEEQLTTIPVETDQEEVAFIFRDRDLVSAPVVDANSRLLGVIHVDDVVDVIDEEHEEDIMRMGGVKQDEFYSSALDAAKSRVVWLVVNLGTAILASLVIGLFSSTIEQLVALAVLMPIVASMGGNAGTQTLTIAVRAIAMKELTPANTLRVVGKEVAVGGVNGVIFAVLVGICTWLWFGDTALAGVIAAAMVVNMVVAGLAGALIPVALDRFGADPAISSSVFLTTVTDVIGFFAFLGLAAIFLL